MKNKKIVIELDIATYDYVVDEDIASLVYRAMQTLSDNSLIKGVDINNIDLKD